MFCPILLDIVAWELLLIRRLLPHAKVVLVYSFVVSVIGTAWSAALVLLSTVEA